jgi:hypothetical protein
LTSLSHSKSHSSRRDQLASRREQTHYSLFFSHASQQVVYMAAECEPLVSFTQLPDGAQGISESGGVRVQSE